MASRRETRHPMRPAFLAAFLCGLLTTLVSTPVVRRAAARLGFLDRPSDRKIHTNPVPYLGGVAIILAFSLALVAGAATQSTPVPAGNLAAILGGGLVVAAIGLWDDWKVVPGWVKVPVVLALGVLLYVTGSRAELFGLWPIDLTVTVAWVIGVTNAINYVDNMDGLSAGIVGIAATYFTVLAGFSGQLLVGGLAAALAGCAIGFLWYNRPPAKIFMGDAGSLFFGFLLASLGLELRFENIVQVSFFVPVAILAVPIADALLVSVSRVRRGLSPIHPGKDHISHRLTALGLSPMAAVSSIWIASAAWGWLGLTIALAEPSTAYMLMGFTISVAAVAAAVLLRTDRSL